jgi:enoyl-[acyl-carrier protein] reductase I
MVDVGREGSQKTMDVSCWSFMRMACLAEPLMKNGGTIFTMTYYGSQMVVKNYNVMGVAKAALESAVRYIAAELGPKGIRVHAISPGPLATRAASGIPEFDELMDKAQSQAPARSLVSIDDVGKATAFLALDGASSSPAACSTSTAAITSSIDGSRFTAATQAGLSSR